NAGAGNVTSIVNSVATGEIEYIATATGVPPASGNVDMNAVNAGDVQVAAVADASGLATANAVVQTGLFEQGNADGDALVDFANVGIVGDEARFAAIPERRSGGDNSAL